MNKFIDIYYENNCYNLEHLNPFYYEFIQKGNNNDDKKYKCLVDFSDHCFTTKQNSIEGTRVFCPIRHELSKKLPEIIKNMHTQKVFFTSAQDKFVKIHDFNTSQEYEVYFSLKKSNDAKCDIYMFINSAYIRDLEKKINFRRKPISFFTIIHNTIINKKIKNPF